MAINEEQRRASIIQRCEHGGEDYVRGELFHPHDFNQVELSVAAEWLYKRDRERNDQMIQESASATRKGIRWAAVSAIAAGIAAIASLVIAIVASCSSLK